MVWQEEIEAYFKKLDGQKPYMRRWALRQAGSGSFPRFIYKFKAVSEMEIRDGAGQVSEILIGNKLWLSSPDQFNDPFDGRIHIDLSGNRTELKYALAASFMRAGGLSKTAALAKIEREKSLSRLEPILLRSVTRARSSIGICSFTSAARDLLLWAHYGASHKGIAIQFCTAMDPRSLCQVLPVSYSDDYPKLRFRETRNGGSENFGEAMVRALTQKADAWKYEQERRLAIQESANSHWHFRPEAITAILLGARISPEAEAYVLGLLSQRPENLPSVRVFKARLHATKYRVEFRGLNAPA